MKWLLPSSIHDFNIFINQDFSFKQTCLTIVHRFYPQTYKNIFYNNAAMMKWTNIHDDLIIFNRMKTENTMRNHSRDIVVPALPKLMELIEKAGVKIYLGSPGQWI